MAIFPQKMTRPEWDIRQDDSVRRRFVRDDDGSSARDESKFDALDVSLIDPSLFNAGQGFTSGNTSRAVCIRACLVAGGRAVFLCASL